MRQEPPFIFALLCALFVRPATSWRPVHTRRRIVVGGVATAQLWPAAAVGAPSPLTLVTDPETYSALSYSPPGRVDVPLLIVLHGAGKNEGTAWDLADPNGEHAGLPPSLLATGRAPAELVDNFAVITPYAAGTRSFYQQPRAKLLRFVEWCCSEAGRTAGCPSVDRMLLHPLIVSATRADPFRNLPPLMLVAASPSTPSPPSDYSGAASALFNNMRAPASLLAGTLLGATWSLAPLSTDGRIVTLVKRMHTLVGLVAACAEFIAIFVCTVAINKLSEIKAPPTTGVSELLASQYELSWLAANANFFVGLLGLVAMTGVRGYLVLASSGSVCFAAAAVCLAVCAGSFMTSAINTGIASGDGTLCGNDAPFGRSFVSLFVNYTGLLIRRSRTAPLTAVSLLCALAATVLSAIGAVATVM